MNGPRATVLIDTYNYGRYIDAAIESVLGQDFPAKEMEILVVDDGSTDDTRERGGKYAGRVKYIWKADGSLRPAATDMDTYDANLVAVPVERVDEVQRSTTARV